MKILQKIITTFMALCLLLGAMPLTSYAAEVGYTPEMEGTYIMDLNAPHNLSYFDGNTHHELPIESASAIIKDGMMTFTLQAYGNRELGYKNIRYSTQVDISDIYYWDDYGNGMIGVEVWIDGFLFQASIDPGKSIAFSGRYFDPEVGVEQWFQLNAIQLPDLSGFDGTYLGDIQVGYVGHEQVDEVTLTIENGKPTLEVRGKEFYLNESGGLPLFVGSYPDSIYYSLYFGEYETLINYNTNTKEIFIAYCVDRSKNTGFDELSMTKKQEIEEPKEINSFIYGSGLSNTYEYMLTVNGYLAGTFYDGTTTLTAAEMQAQKLTVFAYNLTNNATRVQNINTIEKITVTVVNGEVTNVEISGRVQTHPGNFDRYVLNTDALN